MGEEVTVVIPLFGQHRGWETVAAASAAWAAQDTPCEVIVAAAGDRPVRGVAPDQVVRADPAITSLGVLRNLAAARASGGWLYLSDADVAPVGTDYLSRAIGLAGDGALAQPWLLRVLGTAVPGSADLDRRLRGHARRRCCFLQLTDGDQSLVPCPEEWYLWGDENGNLSATAAASAPTELWRDRTPVVRLPPDFPNGPAPGEDCVPFHWGALLVRREDFAALGGYHDAYVGWGCEDDDLLAKVRFHHPVVTAWRDDPSLCCLHYEHPRPYDTPEFAANRARCDDRLAAGEAAMIAADRRSYALDSRP